MSVVTLETSNNKWKWICRNIVIFTGIIKQWFFVTANLGFCLELGLLSSETEIGTEVA